MPHRVRLRWADRAVFIWLYRRYPRILDAITIVRPDTVVRWHRMGVSAYWRWKSRSLGGLIGISHFIAARIAYPDCPELVRSPL